MNQLFKPHTLERDLVEVLSQLPRMCLIVMPGEPLKTALLHRGVPGFTPWKIFDTSEKAQAFVDRMNQDLGVGLNEVVAMTYGSCFGWHTASADPLNWDDEGKWKHQS